MDFTGKIVWVTGAGRGIGFEIANQFTKAGATVVGFDVKFADEKYEFQTETLDITQSTDVARTTQAVLEKSKGTVDVLVNAAGILIMGETDTVSIDDWHRTFQVNVFGAVNMLQQLIPVFKKQRAGAIVTLASNSAHAPRIGMSAYGASKAALRSLSQTVGLELAPYGVRANIVSPGSTDTPMLRSMWPDPETGIKQTIKGYADQYKLGIPLQKVGLPQDTANAVLFLASDLAGHVVMQDIVVDGGATLGQ